MKVTAIASQLRTTDLERAIRFYVDALGFELAFRYQDVGDIDGAASELAGRGVRLLKEAHDTAWGTRELALEDPDGHTLYFGQIAKMRS